MVISSAAQSRTIKARGRAGANAVVAWLQAHGRPHVERRVLMGSADQGDVTGWPGVVIEVKTVKRIDLATFADETEAEIENAGADTGVCVIKRRGTTDVGDWYVLLNVQRWHDLMVEAGR